MPATAVNSRTPIGSVRVIAYNDLRSMFSDLVDSINASIRRSTNGDVITKQQSDAIRADSHKLVMAKFVGPDGRHPYRDTYTPLAPYPALMNKWVASVTGTIIGNAAVWMYRNIPRDIVVELRTRDSRVSLVAEYTDAERKAFIKQQTDLRLFNPNPLAKYEPAHTWVDPNGYQLSDRIWQTGMRTDQKIDAMLNDNIRNGMSSTDLAKAVEKFLLPGRVGYRTDKPYGRDASYDAMRLARTEINHAGNQATLAAGISNPYVTGIDWALSRSHPQHQHDDNCESLCTIDENGDTVRNPYPIEAARIPPGHPHCLCTSRQRVTAKFGEVTDQLREALQVSKQMLIDPYLTPVQYNAYLIQLLGYDPGNMQLPDNLQKTIGFTLNAPISGDSSQPPIVLPPVTATTSVADMHVTEIISSHEDELATIRNEVLNIGVEDTANKDEFVKATRELNTLNNSIKFDLDILKKMKFDTDEEVQARLKFNNNLGDKQKKLADLIAKVEQLKKKIQDEKIAKIAEAIGGSTAKASFTFGGNYRGDSKTRRDEAQAFLNKLFNGDKFNAVKVQVEFIKGRAHGGKDVVSLTKRDSTDTWIHEIMHSLEFQDRAVLNRSVEFLEYRADKDPNGRTIKSMRSLTGVNGYRPEEIGYRDQFDNPYSGKVYQNTYKGPNGTTTKEYFATEILTMGVEALYADAPKFARSDPEYFNYIVSVVRGWIKE